MLKLQYLVLATSLFLPCISGKLKSKNLILAITNYSWIPFSLSNYTGHETLSTHNNQTLELFWVVDDITYMTGGEKQVEFLVASQNGPSWLSFGISQSGGMIGADIVVGRKDEQGNFTLSRMFASGFNMPVDQDYQDVKLVNSFQDDTRTIFIFRRPLNANCQSSQQLEIHLSKPDWFIYAIGSSNTFGKHPAGNVGQKVVDISNVFFGSLKQYDRKADGLLDIKEANVTVLELVTEQLVVPAQDTTYCYTYHSFEDLDKVHIIAEEPIIKTPMLHHMAAYFCDGPITSGYNGIQANTKQNTCNRGSTHPREYCYRSYLIWAVGEKGRIYPDTMGKPIGKGPLNTIHLLLEYHYNNPSSVAGEVDVGSGMRLYLAPPRSMDVGVMFLGAMPQEPETLETMPRITKGNSSFMTSFECPSKCTRGSQYGIPSDGINVINSMMHMHHYGRSGYTRIIRNGTELEPITDMKYFDFNFQNYNYVPKTIKIMPGDRLITSCVWDASNAPEDVLGGYSSQQEMCINWIEYYPAVPLFWCGEVKNPKNPAGLYVCMVPNGQPPLSNVQLKIPSQDTPPFVSFQPECLNQKYNPSNVAATTTLPILPSASPTTSPSVAPSNANNTAGTTLPILPSASPTTSPSVAPSNANNTAGIIGGSVAAAAVVAIAGVAVLMHKRRARMANPSSPSSVSAPPTAL